MLVCFITISAPNKNRTTDNIDSKADKTYVEGQNQQIRIEMQKGDEQNRQELESFKKSDAEKDAIILEYLKSIDSKQNIILNRTK